MLQRTVSEILPYPLSVSDSEIDIQRTTILVESLKQRTTLTVLNLRCKLYARVFTAA